MNTIEPIAPIIRPVGIAITGNRNEHAFEPFSRRSSGVLSLSAFTGLIHQIYTKFTESLKDENPSDLPTAPLDLDKWSYEDKIYLLTFLDLPDLAKFSTTGKSANTLASDPQIWRSIAARIECPINKDFPIYKQVLCFIEDLRRKVIAVVNRPSDIDEILKRPTIDQINHLQNWLKARKTLCIWGGLHNEFNVNIPGLVLQVPEPLIPILKSFMPIPGLVFEVPMPNISHTSQEEIVMAREYNGWFQANRDVLRARDTLLVWLILAGNVALGGPGLNDLITEDAVINKAGEFSDWFHANRDALAQLSELQLLFGLTSLPSEIGELTQLKKLDLGSNILTSLPDCIRNLTQLQLLYLNGNQLTLLPDWIGDLTQLRGLGLNGNQLSALPIEIYKLTQLEKLDLSNNQLTASPRIGKFSQLKLLNLGGNRLLSLPSEIGDLTQLELLDLSNNNFTSLPNEIGNCTKLLGILLSNNQLASLPSQIGKLTHVTELDLSENQLTSLPTQIGDLTQLKNLKLHCNHLTSLPRELGNLTNLDNLTLGNNQLTSIPNEILNHPRISSQHFKGALEIENNPLSLSSRILIKKKRAVAQGDCKKNLLTSNYF